MKAREAMTCSVSRRKPLLLWGLTRSTAWVKAAGQDKVTEQLLLPRPGLRCRLSRGEAQTQRSKVVPCYSSAP